MPVGGEETGEQSTVAPDVVVKKKKKKKAKLDEGNVDVAEGDQGL